MRLCIVGKWPPIQGGVSASTFATALYLAGRGHDVSVLTNSNEVEPNFSQYILPDDVATNAPSGVTVHQVTSGSPFHIPFSKLYASKLLGLGCRVLRDVRPDFIIGYYMEPYGLVAAQLSIAFNIPLILRHAGSDIGRLAINSDLGSAYSWAFDRAEKVLSGSSVLNNKSGETLRRLGVESEKIVRIPSAQLPAWFREIRSELPIEFLSTAFWEKCRKDPITSKYADALCDLVATSVDFSKPTIGMYGKIGYVKGTYKFFEALERIAKDNVPFNVMILAGSSGREMQRFLSFLTQRDERILRRTLVLPFVAPWRVGQFISSCDVVCFLEHDFPIDFHSSRVPREVMVTGTCLVCSKEMAEKQFFRENLVNLKNYVEIRDPNDVDDLTEKLRQLIEAPQRTVQIGKWGQLMARSWEDFLPTADGMGVAIESIAQGRM